MLDKISYTQSNGVWTKTITNQVEELENERYSLQLQIDAFEQGQLIQFSQEVADAITNYQEQLNLLKA